MKYVLLLLLIPLSLFAQDFEFQFEPEAFPVEINGWQPYSPWNMGLEETAPDFADIDADGDLDSFIGHYFDLVRFYRNNGTENSPDFDWETGLSDSIKTFNGASRSNPDFFDLNGDGDLDALVGSGFVTFIENIGTPDQPDFNSQPLQLFDTNNNWIFGTHVALIDIDADGDGDLIGGEYQGHLQFYRNVGTPDSFSFYLEDDYWFDIDVNGYADPTFCDIDEDSDYDLFIGNQFGKLWFYENVGNPDSCAFNLVTNFYDSIDAGNHASPEFADIDGDGDYDLFVGREPTTELTIGDVCFYRNVGSPTDPQFVFITANYLTMDLGPFATNPQIVDINGDGKPDLIPGVGFYLLYFENIGIPQSPEYLLAEEGFQGITHPAIRPFFVDIDDDGDLDLFCGESAVPLIPSIALYLNEGTPQNPNLVLADPEYISNPNFFANINPGLADIDADLDYDLFATDDHGNFYFYENTGSPSHPNFAFQDSTWQGIEFFYPYDNGRGFCFADLDEDGDLDLLMQSLYTEVADANVRFYRNVGRPDSAVMQMETDMFLPGYTIYLACPYTVDIDLDGDLDLFCADGDAGIFFFRNVTGQNEVGPKRPDIPYPKLDFSIGPNPANPVTWISFSLPAPQEATVVVYNILGAKVTTLTSGLQMPGTHNFIWNASQYSSGVYIIRLETPQQTFSQRVITIK
jgi:hypothetical protein